MQRSKDVEEHTFYSTKQGQEMWLQTCEKALLHYKKAMEQENVSVLKTLLQQRGSDESDANQKSDDQEGGIGSGV